MQLGPPPSIAQSHTACYSAEHNSQQRQHGRVKSVPKREMAHVSKLAPAPVLATGVSASAMPSSRSTGAMPSNESVDATHNNVMATVPVSNVTILHDVNLQDSEFAEIREDNNTQGVSGATVVTIAQNNNSMSSVILFGWAKFRQRFGDAILSHLACFMLGGAAMLLFYLTEKYESIHLLRVFIYFLGGTSGNVFMALYIVPYIPEDVWDALHSIEEDHGLDPKRRRHLRIRCYAFGFIMIAISMTIYEITTTSTITAVRVFYVYVYAAGGIGANAFFYLWILPKFPHSLRIALHKIDQRDVH